MIGFDDIPEAAFFRPPLSTVKQDFATLAKSSVECLMSQLNHNKTGRLRTIRPTLVGRESTAPPQKKRIGVSKPRHVLPAPIRSPAP